MTTTFACLFWVTGNIWGHQSNPLQKRTRMHKCSGTTANKFIAKTVYATNLLHKSFSSKRRSVFTEYSLSIHSVSNLQVASMRLILVLLLVSCLFALIADSRRKPQKKPSKKPPKKPSKPAKKPGRPAKPGKTAFFLAQLNKWHCLSVPWSVGAN